LHGFLSYILKCAVTGKPYTIIGYKGKQVRDQIHCADVIAVFDRFIVTPKPGEAYNIGGGKENSASIIEVIDMLSEHGLKLKWDYKESPRIGDHICYYSDLRKLKAHFPGWQLEHSLPSIVADIVEAERRKLAAP
jgi:CDP-paratose 2-epimerase